ncbi:LLM class flavin-dependent oxidoreductase [Pseudonocardia sp. H11422]|uniref:LLM class flavin-dependent oxidoreductase n=1 Tax=Pseudonocardia sp. H11422 TaxID=2835866 RepID=UPI001BDD165D|nr:LLM class flavin-dependent oxidoreductase [Pseudonocardia sp. H11422]
MDVTSALGAGYGLTVFTAGHGPERFRRAAEIARSAERASFSAVWVSELYNRSATVPMAALAGATERILIGSNIAYGAARSPMILAAEARDLDELSGGRIVLGLGNGTPGMMQNWMGVDGSAPAVRMEELVEVLRKLWRLHEGPVAHEGRFYSLAIKPTIPTAPPVQDPLPIWTAGVNPRMVRAAGRVADGLVGHPMMTAEYVADVLRPELASGAAEAGRDVEIGVSGTRICSVDEDEEAARSRAAFAIAQYAAARVYDRLFALHGWSSAQETIRAAAKARDSAAMTAAVTDEMIDAMAIACRPEDLARLAARHAEPFDHLNLTAPPWGLEPEEIEGATRRIVALLAEPVPAAGVRS